MKSLSILIVCILTLATFSSVSGQTFTSADKDTLAGIRIIKVLVEGLDTETEAGGLRKNQIQTDAELRLRRAGIKVEDKPLLPYLYINLNTLKHKSLPMFSYSIQVDFNQEVILERDKSISAYASTWHKGSIGTVGELNLQQIRGAINDVVDKFINDYLAANSSSVVRDVPPPPPPPSSKTSQDNTPNFVARYVGGNRPPQIEVKNTADRTLNLDFSGSKFVILSGESKVIDTTDGGTFSFEATAPGVIPLKGQRIFERGYVYTWTFYIRTSK